MGRALPAVGLSVLVALGAAGFATPPHGAVKGPESIPGPVSESVPVGSVPTPQVGEPDGVDEGAAATESDPLGSVSSATPSELPASVLDPGEVDSLLAELDAHLLGLDSLLNDAAAAMAAEEGEILP